MLVTVWPSPTPWRRNDRFMTSRASTGAPHISLDREDEESLQTVSLPRPPGPTPSGQQQSSGPISQ